MSVRHADWGLTGEPAYNEMSWFVAFMHSPWGSHYTKWRAHGISSCGFYAISGSCCSCGHPSPSPASAVSGQGFPPHFPLLLLIALGSWWLNSCLKLRAAISLKCRFPECSRELCMKRPTALCASMLLPPLEDSRDAAHHSWPIVQSVNCSVQLYVGPLRIMYF